jgi:hypothetical protein
MSDIEVRTDEDIRSKQNEHIVKNTPTVAEQERLTDGMNEWSKLKAQNISEVGRISINSCTWFS